MNSHYKEFQKRRSSVSSFTSNVTRRESLKGRRSSLPFMRSESRKSEDAEAMLNNSFEVTAEVIPDFLDARNFIFPVVKLWPWIKAAKDTLQHTDPKFVLICKQISNTNTGVAYALVHDEKNTQRYITLADLHYWLINEKELKKIAKENLIKKIGFIEKTGPLFRETQMGLHFCNKLSYLTASLLAVPDVFNMIPFQNRDYVILCPTPDVVFVTHSQDPSTLCMLGDLSLRYGQKEEKLLCLKPLRISRGILTLYEPSLVRNESPVPKTEDQLESVKKTAARKSRKMSISSTNYAF